MWTSAAAGGVGNPLSPSVAAASVAVAPPHPVEDLSAGWFNARFTRPEESHWGKVFEGKQVRILFVRHIK